MEESKNNSQAQSPAQSPASGQIQALGQSPASGQIQSLGQSPASGEIQSLGQSPASGEIQSLGQSPASGQIQGESQNQSPDVYYSLLNSGPALIITPRNNEYAYQISSTPGYVSLPNNGSLYVKKANLQNENTYSLNNLTAGTPYNLTILASYNGSGNFKDPAKYTSAPTVVSFTTPPPQQQQQQGSPQHNPLIAVIASTLNLLGVLPGNNPNTATASCPYGKKSYADTKTFMTTPQANLGNMTPYKYINIDANQKYVLDPILDAQQYTSIGASYNADMLRSWVNFVYCSFCGNDIDKPKASILGDRINVILGNMVANCVIGNANANQFKVSPEMNSLYQLWVLDSITQSNLNIVIDDNMKDDFLSVGGMLYENKCYYVAPPSSGGTRILKAKAKGRGRKEKATRKLRG